jgi:uncharacterized membrane protein
MSMQTSNSTTDPKTWTLIVWGLYVASFFTCGLTAIIGVVIAYVKRGELAGTPFDSHMTYAIRTFWISLIGYLIGGALLIVGIGLLILLAVFVWQIYRTIRGIIRALDSQPIDNPEGWL